MKEEIASLKQQRDELQEDVSTLRTHQSAMEMQLERITEENQALHNELRAAQQAHQEMRNTVDSIMCFLAADSSLPQELINYNSQQNKQSDYFDASTPRPHKKRKGTNGSALISVDALVSPLPSQTATEGVWEEDFERFLQHAAAAVAVVGDEDRDENLTVDIVGGSDIHKNHLNRKRKRTSLSRRPRVDVSMCGAEEKRSYSGLLSAAMDTEGEFPAVLGSAMAMSPPPSANARDVDLARLF